jgi:hypothetical protein
MEIDNVLDEKILKFISNLGLSPQSIYLGAYEWELFCAKAREVSNVFISDKLQSDNIPEYKGIKIYKVNIPTHFGIGI